MSASVLKKTIQCGRSISTAVNVVRHKHTLIPGEGRQGIEAVGTQQQQPHQQIHQVVSAVQSAVPPPPSVFMPPNVENLRASEKARFSPKRTRDTSSAHIAAYGNLFASGLGNSGGMQNTSYNQGSVPVDSHVEVYDCSDTVTLDSLIQTNVPQPYEISGQAPSQFSSPDCHGAQGDKYVSGDLQDHHHSTQWNSASKKKSVA